MTSAELRQLQIMAGVIGFGSLLFFLLSLGAILHQQAFAPEWWTLVAIAATYGAPLVVAAVVPALRLRGARIALAASAIVFLAAMLSAFVAVSPVDGAEPLWIAHNTAAATSAAALAWRPVPTWTYNLLVAVVVAAERVHNSAGTDLLLGVQDGLYAFMFSAVFIGLGHLTLARSRRLDAETRTAAADAAHAAARAARDVERGRVDALLHDTVLASLRAATAGAAPGPEGALAMVRQAQRTLGILAREAGHDIRDDARIGLGEVRAMLAARLASVDEHLAVRFLGSPRGTVPVTVAEAVADAAAEAARNSLRHAGAAEPPTVTLSAVPGEPAGVLVTVSDDGVGFDPAAVPGDRLGLRRSVFGRLDGLPGGSAAIRSAAGSGTRVELRWVER